MIPREILEGLNTIVKGLNIATGDLTDSFGKLTKDGERILEGVVCQGYEPNDAERIRTTYQPKDGGIYDAVPELLVRLANPGGDRGVRVAMKWIWRCVPSGTVDNKALNRVLSWHGVPEGGKPIMTKGGKHKAPVPVTGKGAGIQPGTGTPVDSDMLRTDPFGWIMKHIAPKAVELAKKSLTKEETKEAERRAQRVKDEGGTDEEIAEAKTPLRARIQGMLDKMFPGMPSSARTALSETVFGETQARSSLAQGKDALKNLKDSGNKIFAWISWVH